MFSVFHEIIFFISVIFHVQEEMSSHGVWTVTVSWAWGRRWSCGTHLSWCPLWPEWRCARFQLERPTLCSSHSRGWCTAAAPINLASWGSTGWTRRVQIFHSLNGSWTSLSFIRALMYHSCRYLKLLLILNRQVQHPYCTSAQTSGCCLHKLWRSTLCCVNKGTNVSNPFSVAPSLLYRFLITGSDGVEFQFPGWQGFHVWRGTPWSARSQFHCWWTEAQTGLGRGWTCLTDLLWQVLILGDTIRTLWSQYVCVGSQYSRLR